MQSETQQWRVLLADVEPVQRLLLGRVLSRAGFEVETASDEREAVEKIRTGKFQLMVDGIGLSRMIRTMGLRHYVYTIVISSRDAVEHVVMSLHEGADDYLTKPVMEPELVARIRTGIRFIEMEQSLRVVAEESRRIAYSHPVTEVFNRLYLMEHLPIEIEKARKGRYSLSLVICDIDHLKDVNDKHGHAAGGLVLVEVARLLERHALTANGWLAHHGGDEFAIVLPRYALRAARVFSEFVCESLSKSGIQLGVTKIFITASFGVTAIGRRSKDPNKLDQLLRMADQCVYESKAAGRNRVSIGGLTR